MNIADYPAIAKITLIMAHDMGALNRTTDTKQWYQHVNQVFTCFPTTYSTKQLKEMLAQWEAWAATLPDDLQEVVAIGETEEIDIITSDCPNNDLFNHLLNEVFMLAGNL